MRQHTYFVAFLVIALTAGCKKKPATTAGSGSSGSSAGSGSAMSAGSGSAMGSGSAEGSAGSAGSAAGSGSAEGSGSAAAAVDPGELQTPESVYYDEGRDIYLISNINGKPSEADHNGYIQMVSPDGTTPASKWLDGTKPGVKLDAPKGSAISGDVFYVADITVVRRFDAKSGKQMPDVKIPGSTFLNDITTDGAGGVFVSDSGLDASFKPTGTDAIWHVTKDGKAKPLVKNKDLGGPNGLAPAGDGALWVVTFKTGELYQVDAKGKKGKAEKLPKGQLDGVVVLDDGNLLVSSWEGKCVYEGKPGGEWKEVATDVESPADIGYDTKRKRLLIPQFNLSKLVVKQL